MSSYFLPALSCVKSTNRQILKQNDPEKKNKPPPTMCVLRKIAFSLRDKKLVQKVIFPKKSLKPLRKFPNRNSQQNQNQTETLKSKNRLKTLQISNQLMIKCNPYRRSISILTEPSPIRNFGSNLINNAVLYQDYASLHTPEVQPCGVQSVVLLSQTRLKKQISNQSTECRCQTADNLSLILTKKSNLGSRELLSHQKSQNNLFDPIQINQKNYNSVVMPGKFKFSKIDEQNSDSSQSLKNVNSLSTRNGCQKTQPDNIQLTQNSSTFALNNCITESFRSKVYVKKNLNEMQIRSAKSIKEEESVDQFSEVLNKSLVNSSNKKISLNGVVFLKKLDDEE